MPETGNSPYQKSDAPVLLLNGYVPENTLASKYTITTIYSVSYNTPRILKDIHITNMPEVPSGAGMPGIETPELGCHDIPCPPSESIPATDWKRALCIPVSTAHISSGSKGIFRRILDPVKSGPLTSVLLERTGRNPTKVREPPGPCTGKQMELPRGKFRALKKNTGLLFIIRDFRKEAFTGYFKIQYTGRMMALVFRKGNVVLAACDDLTGDMALDEICSFKYHWVDVMIHDLDDAQLQLALEFNKSWRVTEDPESLSEEPEKVPGLQAVPPAGGGVESGVLHPEQGAEGPGFNHRENGAAAPEYTPFTHGSAPSLQDDEDAGWKRALIMEIIPGSNGSEILKESANENETDAFADLPEKIPAPQLKFEPISSDSDLYEKKALDLQSARIAAPEPKELWRSMRIYSRQNNSV